MLKALSVKMNRKGDFLFSSKAMIVVVNSTLLMTWRSGWDLISMCVHAYICEWVYHNRSQD